MAPKIQYAPGMSHDLLVDEKKVDGNTVYKVKIECGATGGQYTYASKTHAVDAALKNLLSHYPKDHAVWINPQAASFRREALKYAKGGTRPPKPQPPACAAGAQGTRGAPPSSEAEPEASSNFTGLSSCVNACKRPCLSLEVTA